MNATHRTQPANNTDHLTNYERFQLERYGNILRVTGREEIENGAKEQQRFADQLDAHYESEILNLQ